MARQTLQRLVSIVQKNERLEISVLRARAVLEAWDKKAALKLLGQAKTRAEGFGLPLELQSLGHAILQNAH